MRLVIEDGYSNGALQRLQQLVADHFQVYPVDSCKAWETFEQDGVQARLVHTTVKRGTRLFDNERHDLQALKSKSDMLVAKAFEDLCSWWPKGCLVMWRCRPEIIQDPVAQRMALYFRIGSFHPAPTDEGAAL